MSIICEKKILVNTEVLPTEGNDFQCSGDVILDWFAITGTAGKPKQTRVSVQSECLAVI